MHLLPQVHSRKKRGVLGGVIEGAMLFSDFLSNLKNSFTINSMKNDFIKFTSLTERHTVHPENHTKLLKNRLIDLIYKNFEVIDTFSERYFMICLIIDIAL